MRQPRSSPVTKEMAVKMHELSKLGKFQHEIAAVLSVNQGRVSEVLSGKKFPELRV